jgi:hypothetical protein
MDAECADRFPTPHLRGFECVAIIEKRLIGPELLR